MIDHLLPLAFLAWTVLATGALLRSPIPIIHVSTVVLVPAVAALLVLERIRPEREENRKLDQPLRNEAGHLLVNYQLGYWIGIGGCAAMPSLGLWPERVHLVVQVFLALLLAECIAYWQHRLVHRVPWMFRFHALHHCGTRLNVVRAGRFHFVDLATASFLTFVPHAVLGAPAEIVAWTASFAAVIGVVQHSNVRMRTPAWADWILCTPAAHRAHHSRVLRESDANFGTLVTLFDRLFGTWVPPRGPAPETIGIEGASASSSFWQQVFGPFYRPGPSGM